VGELLRWALVGIGITYLITEAGIFSLPRVLLTRGSPFRTTLFYCPACTGFWVGCALVALWPWAVLDAGVGGFIVSALQSGAALMFLL